MDIQIVTLYRHINNIYKKIDIPCKYSIFKFDVQKSEMILFKPVITQRIFEILSYMIQGYTEKEIAKKLGITVSTIKKHKENIFKYNSHVSSIFQFISFCIIYGNIDFFIKEECDG